MSIVAVAAEPIHLTQVSGGGLFGHSTNANYFRSTASRCAMVPTGSSQANALVFPTINNEAWLHFTHRVNTLDVATVGYWMGFFVKSTGVGIAGMKVVSGSPTGTQKYQLYVNNVAQTGYYVDIVRDRLHTIDFYIKLHATTGEIKLYVDDSLAFTWTGNTTAGGTSFDSVRFYARSSSTYYDDDFYSEIFVDNAVSTIGRRLVTLPPVADGVVSGWTGAYTDIDDIEAAFTDFISTDTVGAVYTADGQNIDPSFVGWDVVAVATTAAVRISSDSAVADLRTVVRLNGTNYESTSFGVVKDSSIQTLKDIRAVNPDTGVAWTRSDIDGAQFGIKAV